MKFKSEQFLQNNHTLKTKMLAKNDAETFWLQS